MLKSIAVLAGGRTSVSALNFARNILLARLVSVEDYGIASTFIIAIAFIELIADLGLERMVVQDPAGESRKFIGTIQAIMVLRGLLLAGLMFFIAGPIAAVFNHPELTWAYQLFGLAPLLHGLINLDVTRMQRRMSFGPQMKAELGGAILSLAVLWPLAEWLGDYRVMLIAILAEHFLRCIITQIIAEHRLTLAWNNADAKRALRFGIPLLLSGLLAFAAMQGDRVIVGNQFTARDLGLFSAAATLAMTPSLIAARIFQTFFLPLLSRAQNDQAKFDAQAALTLQTMLCLGGFAALAFSIAGPTVFLLAFGSKMAEGALYLVPIGLAFSILLVRSGSMLPIALARGFTLNPLLGNMVRLISLPLAWIVVTKGGDIMDLVTVTIGAEIASLTLTGTLLTLKLKIGAPRRMLGSYTLGLMLVAAVTYRAVTEEQGLWMFAMQVALYAAMVATCGDLRRTLINQGKTYLAGIKSRKP